MYYKIIKNRLNILLKHKVVQFRNNKIVLSSHFKLYWEKYPFKHNIEKYVGNTIKEKIYRFLFDDNNIHKCIWCGYKTKYKTLNKGFDDYCSSECVREHIRYKEILTTKGYKHSEKSKQKMKGPRYNISGNKNPFKNACNKNPQLKKKASDRKRNWWKSLSTQEYKQVKEYMMKDLKK